MVGPGQIIKNQINLGTYRDNSILFEDLCFTETAPPMGRWMGGWVGGLICGSMGWVRSYN